MYYKYPKCILLDKKKEKKATHTESEICTNLKMSIAKLSTKLLFNYVMPGVAMIKITHFLLFLHETLEYFNAMLDSVSLIDFSWSKK